MSEHTKGPWEVQSRYIGGNYALDPDQEVIAVGGNVGDIALMSNTLPVHVQEANARLIAAAPVLLETCEVGIKYLDSCNSGIGLESEKQNKTAFRRILEAVIDKATD